VTLKKPQKPSAFYDRCQPCFSKGSLAGLTTSCSAVDIRTCYVSICLSGVGVKVVKVKQAHQADKASQELRVTVVHQVKQAHQENQMPQSYQDLKETKATQALKVHQELMVGPLK